MALRITRRPGEGFWIGDAFVRLDRSPKHGRAIQVSITADRSVPVTRAEIDGRPEPDVEPAREGADHG